MTGDVYIYGPIGTDRGEVSFDNVKSQIDQLSAADTLNLHIITPGGDVFEGEAIYNLLKNSGKSIRTYMEGTVASIGTLIAGAADPGELYMNSVGRFMVHNPKISGLQTSADSRDLRHFANQLDQIKTLLIGVWDKRTSIGKEKLSELYDNETWLTAAEAKAMGFADHVEDAIKAVAKADFKKFTMKNKPSWIQQVLNLLKIKNEYTETLADGTVIIVLSDTEDWTGKQVILEDGSPLPPGDYPMADGKVLTVADGGVISTVTDAMPQDQQPEQNKEAQPTENEMKEIETLKAQLAEAQAKIAATEADKAAAQAEAVTAKQSAVKFENRLKVIEEVLEKAGQTVGDKTPVKVAGGNGQKMINKDQKSDPMGDFALSFYMKRGIINNNDED